MDLDDLLDEFKDGSAKNGDKSRDNIKSHLTGSAQKRISKSELPKFIDQTNDKGSRKALQKYSNEDSYPSIGEYMSSYGIKVPVDSLGGERIAG
jgi:hypothetical protein